VTDDPDTETLTVEGPDGEREAVELPAGMADVFADPGESAALVAADFLVHAFAQQGHALAHHSGDDVPDDVVALNDRMEELFEERFGFSMADATGHEH